MFMINFFRSQLVYEFTHWLKENSSWKIELLSVSSAHANSCPQCHPNSHSSTALTHSSISPGFPPSSRNVTYLLVGKPHFGNRTGIWIFHRWGNSRRMVPTTAEGHISTNCSSDAGHWYERLFHLELVEWPASCSSINEWPWSSANCNRYID